MAFRIFGGREGKNRSSAAVASADVRDNRALAQAGGEVRLAAGPQAPAAPPAPEADPLAEFKKSKAYRVLLETGRIDKDCKIVNPYFRVEVVEQGHVVFNVVYKLHAIFNFKAILTYWNGQSDEHSTRGNNDGSLWHWTVKRATEAEYIENVKELRNQGRYGGP